MVTIVKGPDVQLNSDAVRVPRCFHFAGSRYLGGCLSVTWALMVSARKGSDNPGTAQWFASFIF